FKFDINQIDVPRIETIANSQQEKALELLKQNVSPIDNANKFLAALHGKVTTYSKEELANAVVNSLYDKFLKYSVPTKELELPSADGHDAPDSAYCEFFMSIGEDDGVNKDDIIDYLTSSNKLARHDIKKIKLLRKHSLAVVPAALAQDAMQTLIGKSIGRNCVRIDIPDEVPDLERGGGRRRMQSRDSRSHSGGRDGGFRRRGNDEPRGERRPFGREKIY